MTGSPLTQIKFQSFAISSQILKGLHEAQYQYCTPIQEKTLPISLTGKNVAGQAQTGTGKTAAFLVATFQYLLNSADGNKSQVPRALILAPTRELAIQIYDEALILGKYSEFRIGLVYGGTGYRQQLQTISDGVDIIIATPGRLIDYYKQKAFTLKHIQVAVIDEADRMFDLGFIADIRFLLRRMPPPEQRLNLLFSATLSYRVTELAYEHMDSPEIVRIEPEQITVKEVDQSIYCPSNDQKIRLLIGLLWKKAPSRGIIFVNTKRCAEKVYGFLKANEFSAGLLSGDVPQQKRQRLLERFRSADLAILIATDVAARGLHIPMVSHVFNYDLPTNEEDYVHRIGRTARLGERGEAISLACEEYVYSLPDIEDYIGEKITIAKITDDLLPTVKSPAGNRPRKAGFKGSKHPGQKNPNYRGRNRSVNRSPRKTNEDG